jgi:alpha-mannosidase
VWGSSVNAGGSESREKTPEGTPFDVRVWVGPDGESVLAGLNPGSYDSNIETDLSKLLPPAKPNRISKNFKTSVNFCDSCVQER